MAEENMKPAPRDLDAITRDNQLNSPLLRLPPEIRNRIYSFTFSMSDIASVNPITNRIEYYVGRRPPRIMLGLVQSCTQCRHEALPFFWKTAIFPLRSGGLPALFDGIRPSVRNQIQILRLQYRRPREFMKDVKSYRNQGGCSSLRKVDIWFQRMISIAQEEKVRKALREMFGEGVEIGSSHW